MANLALDPERYRSDHAQLRSHTHAVEADCLAVLRGFRSHSLSEQSAVDLPDRIDTKYVMPIRLLLPLLQASVAEHTVLQSVGQRIFTYENTYFDTPGWDLYLNHHNGKLSRHKYRFRRYHETDVSYLEMKLKNNKRRTVKTRLTLHRGQPAADLAETAVVARLYVNYRRITLWNRLTDSRVTLDYDLCFRRPHQAKTVRLEDVFIAEHKRQGNAYNSTFYRLVKGYGYLPQSFSKYCIGVCLTDEGALKHNRFKPVLRKLGQIRSNGEVVR